MTPQVFELGRGRVFVAGLFWQPLAGTAKERRKAAEKIATEQNFDLAVWRTSNVVQVGMGSSAEGIKAGMYAAAAIVSKTVELETGSGDFLAATEISPGKWLYCAQRDGIIAPDGDFVGGEDEVRSRLLADLSLSDWAHVIAPEHWNVAHAAERTFESFLPAGGRSEYRRWWALRAVRQNPIRRYAPYALIVLAAIGTAYEYRAWQQAKRERALAQAERIAASSQAQANRKVRLPDPWKNKARAKAFTASCMNAMGKLQALWVAGWTLERIGCASGALSVLWQRSDSGWIGEMTALHPNAAVSPDGTHVRLTEGLPTSAGTDEAAPTEMRRRIALLDSAQRYGLQLELTEPAAPAVLPGNRPAAQAGLKRWKTLSWRVRHTRVSPTLVVALLDGAAFRVNAIDARFRGAEIEWDLEGNQYVQKP